MRNTDSHKYKDIINLPHPTSKSHPRMSMAERAAQFSPFAALTGYGGVIQEAGRLTEMKKELGDSEIEELERNLSRLAENAGQRPLISVTYFQPDKKKKGGAYITVTGRFKEINEAEHRLLLTDRTEIPIENILRIENAE